MPEPFQAKAAEAAKAATAATSEWTVTFSSGDSPTSEGNIELGKALAALKDGSEKITIVGHVDTVPPKKGVTNAQVAMSRAVKVYNFLQAHGIDAARITPLALPDSEPMERVAIITVEKTAKSAAK
jgi:flagellar motor protein MotB